MTHGCGIVRTARDFAASAGSALCDNVAAAHEDAQLANLVCERLARHVERRGGAILIAVRLHKRLLDEVAAEARHRILIRAAAAARAEDRAANSPRKMCDVHRRGPARSRGPRPEGYLQFAHL